LTAVAILGRIPRDIGTGIMKIVSTLKYDKDGLIPAVVQDSASKQVLMLAYMSAETLQRTLETGQTYFWSRSRQQVWHKGETSGNIQEVVDIKLDCDGDALLILVNPSGPACHTGKMTCFHNRVTHEIKS
jgi:phosphoribosyl-ATP pyrophosphohydrolase/phosphoribosyl-AMP cyclohydrolase